MSHAGNGDKTSFVLFFYESMVTFLILWTGNFRFATFHSYQDSTFKRLSHVKVQLGEEETRTSWLSNNLGGGKEKHFWPRRSKKKKCGSIGVKEEEGAPEINQESREGVRALECIQGERKGEKIKREEKKGEGKQERENLLQTET